jgi:ParB family transcriptional regulator, chromosome partitioning protein
VDAARQDRDAQLHRLADEALARVKDDPKKQRQARRGGKLCLRVIRCGRST